MSTLRPAVALAIDGHNNRNDPATAAAAAGEEVKQESGSHVIIKLQDVRNKEMYFWVKRNDPIGQVLLAFSHQEGLNYNAMRFVFDGVRVKEQHTPKDLGMDDGDVINVFSDQTGG